MTSGIKLSNALDRARARGRVRSAELLDDPDMLTAEQLALRLGISADGVEELRQDNRVLGLSLLGEIRFPVCQVGPNGALALHIDQVVARLNESPLTAYRLLMSRAHDGTGRPFHELLAAGEFDEVLGEADAWIDGAFS